MKPEEIIETANHHAERFWEGFDKATAETRRELDRVIPSIRTWGRLTSGQAEAEEEILKLQEVLKTRLMQQECEHACIPFHGWMYNASFCMRGRRDHSNAYVFERQCDRLFDPFSPKSAIGILKEMRMGKHYGNPYFEKVFGIKEKDLPPVEFD